jgi:hypothetical protein
MAGNFLASYSLILESKRLLLNRLYQGSSRGQRGVAKQIGKDIRTMEADIDRMTAIRDGWALRCSPDDPERWVTMYQRLITKYEATHARLSGQLNRLDSESRSRLLGTDLPCLAGEIKHFKRQLKLWQRRLISQPRGSEGREPAVLSRPRLRVVR